MARQVHVWVPTYNRAGMLYDLLTDLERETKQHPSLLVSIFDDGSADDYSACKALIATHKGWTFTSFEHGGKLQYWRLIGRAHAQLKASKAHYYIQMADDYRLCERFVDQAIEAWESIDDKKKIAVNIVCDVSRKNQSCWGSEPPKTYNDFVTQTGWIDGAQISTRKYYSLIDWSCPDTAERMAAHKSGRGSQVGFVISQVLAAHNMNIYRVIKSLVVHRLAKSAMHPDMNPWRCVGMIADDYIDGHEAHQRLMYMDTVTASLCSIPSREGMLKRCVESLLPQVNHINVMLNGYRHVPGFLKHERITVERSQRVGDYKSDGQFWWCESVKGYNFLCDDDLWYAPNYVAFALAWLEAKDRTAVIGYHGAVLRQPFKSYYKDRITYPCQHKVEGGPHIVDVIGTGALVYHTDTIKLTRENTCCRPITDPREHNMSDMVFSTVARSQNVTCLVIPHSAGFVVQHEADVGIYENSATHNGSEKDSLYFQTEAARGLLRDCVNVEIPVKIVPGPRLGACMKARAIHV